MFPNVSTGWSAAHNPVNATHFWVASFMNNLVTYENCLSEGQDVNSESHCDRFTSCIWTGSDCHMQANSVAGYMTLGSPTATSRGFKVNKLCHGWVWMFFSFLPIFLSFFYGLLKFTSFLSNRSSYLKLIEQWLCLRKMFYNWPLRSFIMKSTMCRLRYVIPVIYDAVCWCSLIVHQLNSTLLNLYPQ